MACRFRRQAVGTPGAAKYWLAKALGCRCEKMMSESSVEEAKEKLQEIEEHEKKLDTDKEEV